MRRSDLSALQWSQHTVFVALPLTQRKHPAVTPYLHYASTKDRAAKVLLASKGIEVPLCIMVVSSIKRHIHTGDPVFEHSASFYVQVGSKAKLWLTQGQRFRASLCITESFAHSVGVYVNHDVR
jgi:hypothetical protein